MFLSAQLEICCTCHPLCGHSCGMLSSSLGTLFSSFKSLYGVYCNLVLFCTYKLAILLGSSSVGFSSVSLLWWIKTYLFISLMTSLSGRAWFIGASASNSVSSRVWGSFPPEKWGYISRCLSSMSWGPAQTPPSLVLEAFVFLGSPVFLSGLH